MKNKVINWEFFAKKNGDPEYVILPTIAVITHKSDSKPELPIEGKGYMIGLFWFRYGIGIIITTTKLVEIKSFSSDGIKLGE